MRCEEVKNPHVLSLGSGPRATRGEGVVSIATGEDSGRSIAIKRIAQDLTTVSKRILLKPCMEGIHDEDKSNGSEGIPLPNRSENRNGVCQTVSSADTTETSIKGSDQDRSKDSRKTKPVTGSQQRKLLDGVESLTTSE